MIRLNLARAVFGMSHDFIELALSAMMHEGHEKCDDEMTLKNWSSSCHVVLLLNLHTRFIRLEPPWRLIKVFANFMYEEKLYIVGCNVTNQNVSQAQGMG